MNIGTTQTSSLVPLNRSEQPSRPPVPQSPDGQQRDEPGIDVSALGRFRSKLDSLGSEDKNAIAGFRDQIKEARTAGEFDANAMAQQAPDALKSVATELGVDINSAVSQLAKTGENDKPGATGQGAAQANLYASVEEQDGQQGLFSGMMNSLFGKG